MDAIIYAISRIYKALDIDLHIQNRSSQHQRVDLSLYGIWHLHLNKHEHHGISSLKKWKCYGTLRVF